MVCDVRNEQYEVENAVFISVPACKIDMKKREIKE